MTGKFKSPYLKSQRLEDVIAAIQVMGKYAFYKLDFENWAMRISGKNSKADHWKQVFSEHPEFFRFNSDGTKASLAWRRSYRKRFDVDEQRDITYSEYEKLDEEKKARISRTPLKGEEITVLLNTAINLHTRAIELNKENRWLSSPLFSLLGVALGAFLGWLVKG